MSSIVGDEMGELVRTVRGQHEVSIGDMAVEVGEDVGEPNAAAGDSRSGCSHGVP